MKRTLTDTIVVPVATEADARGTAEALDALGAHTFGRIIVVHVVEKGDGVPDKTPVEQSETVADKAFATFRNTFPDAETSKVYRRDVVKGIVEYADEVDASAIVFRPRGGSRLVQFLAGDRTLRLVTEADCPVVALPEETEG
ncbi:universal stress protein [Haloarchaeobius amylolyticus]|uniref:universal stress protein n=1 Tax=Haloarchaeobius amylolyticus TaxID=1198296 RepID=UPI00226E7C18|nr:universal stress protein [Haloarchaeobius amylolyticus]